MADTPIPPAFKDPERAARLFDEAAGAGGPDASRPPPPPPEEIAKHFPDLEVLDVIGVGGMGVVYRARHKRLERLVALKVLPKDLATDPQFAERFAREAKTLAGLDHPGIVRVHDFGVVDGLTYLVMEHVDGANLRQVTAAGRLSPAEALAIVPKICEALQYAHDKGVVHRDIKPENVLVDSTGRVKIADFGLAKIVGKPAGAGSLTSVGQVMGTFQYMAPEQYKTPQDVDHRADLYSLGVVFYEMLTGELPVGRFQPPSEAAALDARIDHIVLRALERERALRYQRAEEIRTDIAGLSTPGKGPVPAPTPSLRRALLLSALAFPLGVFAVVILHEAWGGVTRGTSDAAAREIWKGVAGGIVFALGAAAGIVGAVKGASAPAPRRAHKAGMTLVLAHLAALIILSVVVGNEAARHSRVVGLWASPDRIGAARSLPSVKGSEGGRDARELARTVSNDWNMFLGRVREFGGALYLVADEYVRSDRERLRRATPEDIERMGDLGWGGGHYYGVLATHTLLPPHVPKEIEKTPDPDRILVVTGDSTTTSGSVRFPMQFEDGRWKFVIAPVEHVTR